jgi:type VI secretion system ImpA family protein
MAVLDLEKLLKDIPGPNPAGEDFRDRPRSVYHEVKSAVESARRTERKVFEGEPAEPPNWEPVLKLVPDTLATKSKDIEMAAWLTEALLRKHQFQGLSVGVKLMRQLVEKYWDNGLHPNVDDASERLRMLAALNGEPGHDGTLIRAINLVPLTEKIEDLGPFSALDHLRAARTAASKKPSEKDAADAEKIRKAEAQTSADFRKQTAEVLGRCLAEFDGLSAALVKKCRGSAPFSTEELQESLVPGLKEHSDVLSEFLWSRLPEKTRQSLSQGDKADGGAAKLSEELAEQLEAIILKDPFYEEKRFTGVDLSEDARELIAQKPTGYGLVRLNRILLEDVYSLQGSLVAPSCSEIREALENCRTLLNVAPDSNADPSLDPNHKSGPSPTADPVLTPRAGPIRNRKEAFQRLVEVARHFEETEPHSPVSYALRRIVRWGDLSLPKLLTELIQNQSAREEVYKLLGIPETDKDSKDK